MRRFRVPIAWGAAAMLLLAAIGKMAGPVPAAHLMMESGLFTMPVAVVVLWLLVAAEASVALLLVVPKTRASGLLGASVLGAGIFGFGVWRMLQGIEAPCACFGPFVSLSPLTSASIGAVLSGLAFAALGSDASPELVPA
ncbi:hypothetical protein EON79_13505 [bacterium]|nr:MAG: hypothetical protein EON79_13505 [bacterium]